MNGNYFHELAAKYDSWFQTPHGRYVQAYENEMIMSLADIKENMRIADVGCGTGLYTQKLCQHGAKVVGIDISPEMLEIAARKTEQYKDRVEFVRGDAACLPFADCSFDLVFSITAMEFFDKPKQCLHEMHRILRPGGHMVVATLNSLSLWAMQRRIKSIFSETIFTHAHFYSIFDINKMVRPYKISAWRGGIFIPPFFPKWIINNPGGAERMGQKLTPHLGAFIVVRIDK